MNRAEHAVLGALIKSVRRHNPYLWWELKWQISDGGSREFYPRQSEYQFPVRQALKGLSDATLLVLKKEWEKKNPTIQASADEIRAYYETVVIEELVRRAEIAGRQTMHW